jgi:hypothetical protein
MNGRTPLIVIGLLLIIPTVCIAQFHLDRIKERHPISSMCGDTLFFALTTEDSDLANEGRQAYFFTRHNQSSNLVQRQAFGTSSSLEYLIGDFNNDGTDEVLMIGENETRYSVKIFRFDCVDSSYRVSVVFSKKDLWLPHTGKSGASIGFVKVIKSKGKIDHIVLYSGTKQGRLKSWNVRYNKVKGKFEDTLVQ